MRYIFPNPSKGIFQIEYDSESKEVMVVVLDIMGREVKKQVLSEQARYIDLSGEKPGIYLIRLLEGTETKIAKVVLE